MALAGLLHVAAALAAGPCPKGEGAVAFKEACPNEVLSWKSRFIAAKVLDFLLFLLELRLKFTLLVVELWLIGELPVFPNLLGEILAAYSLNDRTDPVRLKLLPVPPASSMTWRMLEFCGLVCCWFPFIDDEGLMFS